MTKGKSSTALNRCSAYDVSFVNFRSHWEWHSRNLGPCPNGSRISNVHTGNRKAIVKPCRQCGHMISERASFCPNCGEPFPWKDKWDGWGYEYKSEITLLGLPFLHISFKYRPDRRPVVAKGFIAIGQFAGGIITISQFGIGVISISQFTVAGFAVAQFALAYSLIAQIGLYLHHGRGMLVWNVVDLIRRLISP